MLQSMGSQRFGRDLATEQHMAEGVSKLSGVGNQRRKDGMVRRALITEDLECQNKELRLSFKSWEKEVFELRKFVGY